MDSAIYEGMVVHKRLAPVRHALRYRVFSLLVALDELEEIDRDCRFLSVNRFNVFSFHECDHGDGRARGLEEHIRSLLDERGVEIGAGRIFLLGYPRVLGYVFNPITVYFCCAPDGELAAIVYEVNNTFGERRSYVVTVGRPADSQFHGCLKELYVSPFNELAGDYTFHLRPYRPGDTDGDPLTISVLYRNDKPVMKAHFSGQRRQLSNAAMLRLAVRYPAMTLKIMAAIHWQALRLWCKRLKLVPRKPVTRYTISPSVPKKTLSTRHG